MLQPWVWRSAGTRGQGSTCGPREPRGPAHRQFAGAIYLPTRRIFVRAFVRTVGGSLSKSPVVGHSDK